MLRDCQQKIPLIITFHSLLKVFICKLHRPDASSGLMVPNIFLFTKAPKDPEEMLALEVLIDKYVNNKYTLLYQPLM